MYHAYVYKVYFPERSPQETRQTFPVVGRKGGGGVLTHVAITTTTTTDDDDNNKGVGWVFSKAGNCVKECFGRGNIVRRTKKNGVR